MLKHWMTLRQAVKIAKAMGCVVTVLSTSESKRAEAVSTLGADHFVVSKDEASMKVRTRHNCDKHLPANLIGCIHLLANTPKCRYQIYSPALLCSQCAVNRTVDKFGAIKIVYRSACNYCNSST